MIRVNGKRGFTLVEMLVVVGLIAVILAALTVSVSSAQERARIQKATAEVKAVTQAILGYENHAKNHELPTMNNQPIDSSSCGFLLGRGGASETGQAIPVLLQASLSGGGKMLDPWGTPYRISIHRGSGTVVFGSANASMKTGYTLPNLYRLSEAERK